MKEETYEGPGVAEGSSGTGKAPGRAKPEAVMEPQEEPGRGIQEHWKTQCQDFNKTLQTPPSTWESSKQSEATTWDDAKAFLVSFEQVAAACHWPKGEWVTRLLPALSGDAQQAFSLLAAKDKENYGKVKAAILRSEALKRETQRQHFREFCCQELGDPRRMYSQVQELCCQWLKPEKHTKEQILELLILEQFLASLPVDIQSWILAGGPDSGAQAVALLEDFLLSRREANTGMWQEPLQEWAVGPLDVKEEPLDMMQEEISGAEIFKDSQHETQYVNGEVALPGIGITHPLLPPEGQNMTEAELTKVLGVPADQVMNSCFLKVKNLRKMGAPLQMIERTLMQSSQQIIFWKVLQEDGENVDSLDDGKRTRLKVKNSQPGGNEPVETPRRGQERTQAKVPLTPEVLEEKCESNRRQGTELLQGCRESGEPTEGITAVCSDLSPVGTKALFSKYGRMYHPKSGYVSEHPGEVYSESLPWEEMIQLNSDLEKHHRSHMEEINHDCPEFGIRSPSNSLEKDQVIHTDEMICKCPNCKENVSQMPDQIKNQKSHTRNKPHQCPECGKSFSRRSYLLNHQMFHAEDKSHKCPECEKNFTRRSTLLIHQMIHTGKKPHQCPKCGKNFSRRSSLLSHQITHTGEKPHKCPDCGKRFSHKSASLRHQKIHVGKNSQQCPECGKKFYRKSHLLIHQMSHKGKVPPQCPECGKKFPQKSHLLNHQMFHTGEKPHKCSSCGKSFSQRSDLIRHQKIHTGKKPHQCLECGKRFCQRSHLLRHQKIHTERNLTGVLCGGKA